MQVMFVLGLELALSYIYTSVIGIARLGLQDDMTFVGWVAALTTAGITLRARSLRQATDCSVRSLGFEQFEDRALPHDIRSLVREGYEKAHGH